MPRIVVSNISTKAIGVGDTESGLYKLIAASGTGTFDVTDAAAQRMSADLDALVTRSLATYTVAQNPSINDKFEWDANGAIATAMIAAQAVTLPKLVRGTNGQIPVATTGADVAYRVLSGDATMTAGGVVTVSGVSASGVSNYASTANGLGASLIGVEDAAAHITGTTAETALAELALEKYELGLTTNGKGASHIGIEDSAALITAVNVETALAELVKYERVLLADPGGANAAIPVTRSSTVEITTAGAETNTLAIPTFIGQQLLLVLDTRVGGNRVITSAQRINTAGNTIITLDTAGDAIGLVAIKIGGAFRWQVSFNDGATLS